MQERDASFRAPSGTSCTCRTSPLLRGGNLCLGQRHQVRSLALSPWAPWGAVQKAWAQGVMAIFWASPSLGSQSRAQPLRAEARPLGLSPAGSLPGRRSSSDPKTPNDCRCETAARMLRSLNISCLRLGSSKGSNSATEEVHGGGRFMELTEVLRLQRLSWAPVQAPPHRRRAGRDLSFGACSLAWAKSSRSRALACRKPDERPCTTA